MVQAALWVLSGRGGFAGKELSRERAFDAAFPRSGAIQQQRCWPGEAWGRHGWGGGKQGWGEAEHNLSRAGWVLCTACWGNGRICGCRWPGFGESRVQLSCHTHRSVADRQSCRLTE